MLPNNETNDIHSIAGLWGDVHVTKKVASRDLVIMANLGLRNETIWAGFLWYLTAPSGETKSSRPGPPMATG